jgi:predicted RNA-binding protein with PUA-like domain
MSHWLFKTEPSEYSWDDLQRDGRAVWDGITNPLALRHLRSARTGDSVILYHTGSERQLVGLAEIVAAPYADPRAKDPRRVVVDIVPVGPLASRVTLAQIKADPAFAGWELLRMGRLSVVPVPPELWKRLLKLAGAR